jgi:copper(I)-binding protein
MWVEFDFGNSHVITTGPKQPIKIGEKVVWDYHSKQGVHLFYNNQKTMCSSENSAIDVKVDFIPKEGKLDFKFSPKWL